MQTLSDEERQQRLEERFASLEERQRLEREMVDSRRVLSVIGHRFGVLSEAGFGEAMKGVVEEIFGVAEVDRWVYRDEVGVVYGSPAVVEVDVLVKDGENILLEVKSRVCKGDVSILARKGELYEKVTKVKPRLAIIGGFIDRDAYVLAKRVNVEIKPISEDLII